MIPNTSRCSMSSDQNDENVITPDHFLIDDSLFTRPWQLGASNSATILGQITLKNSRSGCSRKTTIVFVLINKDDR